MKINLANMNQFLLKMKLTVKNKNVNHSKALIFQYGASADRTADSNIQHSDVF